MESVGKVPEEARGDGIAPTEGRNGGGGRLPVVRVSTGGMGALSRWGGGGSGPVAGRCAGGGGAMGPLRLMEGGGSDPVAGSPAAAGRGPEERRGGGSGPVEVRLEISGNEPEPARGTGGSGPVLARPSGEVAVEGAGGASGGTVGGCRTVCGAAPDGGAEGEPFAPGFFFNKRENFS